MFLILILIREFVLRSSCGEENPRKRAHLLYFLNIADNAAYESVDKECRVVDALS